jgi:hypothetical protein
MPRLRFETARDLLDAYPAARDELLIEPVDTPSLAFLGELSGQQPVDKAIGFCAYLLPRREAVWWGCQCVRMLAPPNDNQEAVALRAAEEWVHLPEEGQRLSALAIGRQSNYRAATTWLALAAGWAGPGMPPGSLAGFEGAALPANDAWLPIPPDYTAKAVRSGILIAAAKTPPQQRTELLKRCVADGSRLAAGEAART